LVEEIESTVNPPMSIVLYLSSAPYGNWFLNFSNSPCGFAIYSCTNFAAAIASLSNLKK
jgi:hypothetical protein